MYICVDFDGTMVDHCFPEIGTPVPLAIQMLRGLVNEGHKIILFTMRSNNEKRNFLDEAVAYMENAGIELYGINRNPSQDSWTSSPKAYAHLYIDDAAFGCPLIQPENFNRMCVDWSKVYEEIMWKRDDPVEILPVEEC